MNDSRKEFLDAFDKQQSAIAEIRRLLNELAIEIGIKVDK